MKQAIKRKKKTTLLDISAEEVVQVQEILKLLQDLSEHQENLANFVAEETIPNDDNDDVGSVINEKKEKSADNFWKYTSFVLMIICSYILWIYLLDHV